MEILKNKPSKVINNNKISFITETVPQQLQFYMNFEITRECSLQGSEHEDVELYILYIIIGYGYSLSSKKMHVLWDIQVKYCKLYYKCAAVNATGCKFDFHSSNI